MAVNHVVAGSSPALGAYYLLPIEGSAKSSISSTFPIINMAKGQIFSLDFAFSLVTFFTAVILILFVLSHASTQAYERMDLNNMELKATKIADLLVRFKGSPENWTSASVKAVGLADDENILSASKINEFLSLDYNSTKSILSIGNYEFFFTIVDHENQPLIHMPHNITSVVGGWNFEESYENTAYDFSPNGNHADLNCTSLCTLPSRSKGYVSKGVTYDGVDDFASIANSPSINPSQISIEAWINVNSYPSGGESYMLSKNGGNFDGWIFKLGIAGNASAGFARQPSAEVYAAFGNVSKNAWHHLAATYGGTTLNTYKDGSPADTQTLSGGYTAAGIGMAIGKASWANIGYFNGTIDEVRIYNRTLSPTEVLEHYRGGYGRFYSDAKTIIPVERYALLNSSLAKVRLILWK